MNKIELTLAFLNQKFDESKYLSENLKDKKYRYEHTLRVANIGKIIAINEGFDVEAFVVACLLHDVGYCENLITREDWLNHGRNSANITREFVETLGFDKKTENDILYGIAIHVDDKSDFKGERTPFALCVSDADNIDRFDTYRIVEAFKNDKFEDLPYDNQLQLCTNRIASLEKYLKEEFATITSTKMMREKLSFQIQFYSKLKMQLENSKTINL